jgi:drug/metabolite transporter, DME family
VTLAFATSSLTFIVSMKTTTVANALFLSSCAPLLAAALGFVVLGERLNLWQAGSIALGFFGILVIVGGGLEAGSFVGNICAVVTAVGFAVASVTMRFGGDRDYSPAVLGYALVALTVAGLVCAFFGLPIMTHSVDALAALSAGLLPMGLGFAFFLAGAPRVPAAAQTVLAQTETIFGPFWVWLAFGETPSAPTLAGGAVIFAAVLSMAVATAARTPARASAPLAP